MFAMRNKANMDILPKKILFRYILTLIRRNELLFMLRLVLFLKQILPTQVAAYEYAGLDFHGSCMSRITRNTVDSRYLEFQGTLLNTSRYPYFDI